MRKDDVVRLRHMLDAAQEALSFIQGRSRADLNADRQLVLSLVKEVEIVGEAAYQLPQETRASMPDVIQNFYKLNKSKKNKEVFIIYSD